MKIRNGFVSNSSSSSFILIADDDNIKKSSCCGKTYKRGNHTFTEFEDVDVDASGEITYNRDDIMKVTSISDKVKYVLALYASWYQGDKNYLFKICKIVKKLQKLGRKYGYCFWIKYPPLYGSLTNEKWDDSKREHIKCKEHVETYVDVSTECNYVGSIARMLDNKDTKELESFLFNEHSFCILGGDEYEETFKLEKEAKKEVNYPYHRYADYPDCEKGSDPDYPEYEHHWGEDLIL